MGVSKNTGTPKWMVYNVKWMIWGYPYFLKHLYVYIYIYIMVGVFLGMFLG